MKKVTILFFAVLLVVGLALPMASVAAVPDGIDLVSDTSTETAGWTNTPPSDPLDPNEYSGGGSWISAVDLASPHSSWYNEALVTDAVWISSADSLEGSGTDDQWRLFKKEFVIPCGAVNITADLYMTSDNSVAAYLNGTLISEYGVVYGAAPTPYTDPPDYYFKDLEGPHSISPEVGANTLMFVTRNWVGGTANPTGLLYRVEITYDMVDMGPVTQTEGYNPVGALHTVTVDIGVDVADVVVTFEVSGANGPIVGTATTNGDGIAEFSYTGNNPGMDTITAYIDCNENQSWDEGEPQASSNVTKYWLEHFVTGGGNITEGKGKNAAKITFGGNVGYDLEGNMVGNWNIVLHNVNNDDLDKGHIKITNITEIVFANDANHPELVPDPPDADYHYAHFEADVLFNGEDLGWTIKVSVTDYGEGNKINPDEIRIRIYDGSSSTPIYDTSLEGGEGDFPNSDIANRTPLDGGNIQIHPPEIPTP